MASKKWGRNITNGCYRPCGAGTAFPPLCGSKSAPKPGVIFQNLKHMKQIIIPSEDLVKEMKPSSEYDEENPYKQYASNGKNIYFNEEDILEGADPETFLFYLGGFAKDKKYCWNGAQRISGADPSSFHALSNTFYKDKNHVYYLMGSLKEADSSTFEACDEGRKINYGCNLLTPYGYGKDANNVFYYDFQGKAKIVRKANPQNFVSLNDGVFGKDDDFVFCGASVLQKVEVESWEKLGGYYSKDKRNVFYYNRIIKEADRDTFEVVIPKDGFSQLAKDKNNRYLNDVVVGESGRDYDRWHKNE
ncbi:DKNYY domain-containing protein [Microbulbifer agarilyticus]|uniref:DKNYY domain-containing protein n=1 Tax=Microbulbifer agarilyticus TaxID=260552 RepID=UPI001C94B6B3|nr:DKNYY domain-containing protein [Microbulbifer agarilyticus]MBY6190626.1 DKNYY domain-containing protein [Microbulbifer agarilyticus]